MLYDRRNELGGLTEVSAIRTHHVSIYVEMLTRKYSAPTVKQHLAAIRRMLDWLIVGQVINQNPAAPVRGPQHIVLLSVVLPNRLKMPPSSVLHGRRLRRPVAAFAPLPMVLPREPLQPNKVARAVSVSVHLKAGLAAR